ncbi:MAG: hypothetical protein PWQ57_1170 [Desulfovibrionales bacterium]|jgi:predicted DNA-binding transcriptional regulator AlpA|nr:hypothetical protein [Desulfovibrionales bacterium]
MEFEASRDLVKEAITEAFAPLVEQECLHHKALLNVIETAALLGVSRHTLDHWRSQGLGPRYVALGSRVAYRRQDLNDFLEKNQIVTAD